jgi:hypothetical protein
MDTNVYLESIGRFLYQTLVLGLTCVRTLAPNVVISSRIAVTYAVKFMAIFHTLSPVNQGSRCLGTGHRLTSAIRLLVCALCPPLPEFLA